MKSSAFCGALLLVLAAGCSEVRPGPPPTPTGHLVDERPAPDTAIPDIVQQVPFVPPPEVVPESERYTVVVNDVPVRELLFALARDAELNIDIGGAVDGRITLNAIEQTLPQILERIARQVDLRYEFDDQSIIIGPDTPYLRTYEVGYVNLSREADTTVNVATRVATTGSGSVDASGSGGGGGSRGGGGGSGGAGGGDNSSGTRLSSRTYNRFWETLENNILAILSETDTRGNRVSDRVIINAEAGMVSIRASSREHEQIEEFIDKVLVNARRQVMIEATIVEVSLNDQYQAGVDWALFLDSGAAGFSVDQNLLGQVSDGVIDNAVSNFTLGYFDPNVGDNVLDASVRLLREFGDARVLSSPRLMVLNNQTAILKVVEELVYFTIEVTNRDSTPTQQGSLAVETEIHSVPVGLVMAVTPQISANDEVTLTVRPSVSQKIGDAIDPGPRLAVELRGVGGGEDITNAVPIIRVREMESVLKLIDGQIGVLGGLMQDDTRTGNRQIPGLARLPVLGDLLFNTEELASNKTELVIFLRPVVIDNPSIATDLADYRQFLGGERTPPRLGADPAPVP